MTSTIYLQGILAAFEETRGGDGGAGRGGRGEAVNVVKAGGASLTVLPLTWPYSHSAHSFSKI